MLNPPSSRGGSSFLRLCLLLATGFNLGRIPYAPGTVGSLGALLVFLPFRDLPWTFHLSVVALLFCGDLRGTPGGDCPFGQGSPHGDHR